MIAKSRNEADAIEEAKKMAIQYSVSLPIEVRECGTRKCIAKITGEGIVFDATNRSTNELDRSVKELPCQHDMSKSQS